VAAPFLVVTKRLLRCLIHGDDTARSKLRRT
jgi:hypothetical protein